LSELDFELINKKTTALALVTCCSSGTSVRVSMPACVCVVSRNSSVHVQEF